MPKLNHSIGDLLLAQGDKGGSSAVMEAPPKIESANTSIVSAAAIVPQTSLACRFVKVTGENEKLPVARAIVSLPIPMDGLTIEAPIFAERDKKGAITAITVALPGGKRFAALKPEVMQITDKGGTVHYLSDQPTDKGGDKISNWEPQIKTAWYAWQQTGNPLQTITL